MVIRTSESGNITMFRAYHVPNHGREGKGEKPSTQETFTEEGKGRGEPHLSATSCFPPPGQDGKDGHINSRVCQQNKVKDCIMILTLDSLVGGKWYEYYLEKTSN